MNRLGGDECHLVFGENMPREKGGMRLCVVVTQQPVLLSSKCGADSSQIFAQSPWSATIVSGTDRLVCREESLVNDLLHVKENDEYSHEI
jgi:hypothetical protein